MEKLAAVTGHTARLGQAFYLELERRGYKVYGFSRSTGHDLRDYSVVTKIIEDITGFDLFVNNAKPDFVQTQILYRLVRSCAVKHIISIGSAAVEHPPEWSDTFLLEYLTQKTALAHAHSVLSTINQTRLSLINLKHMDNPKEQVCKILKDVLENDT